jgi:hypothetical protein
MSALAGYEAVLLALCRPRAKQWFLAICGRWSSAGRRPLSDNPVLDIGQLAYGMRAAC